MIVEPPIICNSYTESDCPCILAEIYSCPQCSHLAGGKLCDCNWLGTCIYQDYVWNQSKGLSALPSDVQLKAVKSFSLSASTVLGYYQIKSNLLQSFKQFASVYYCHYNNPNSSQSPGTILEVFPEQQLVEISFYARNPKEKYYLLNPKNPQLIAGSQTPLLGVNKLKKAEKANVLIYCQGYGSSLVPAIIKFLQKKENKVSVCLAENNNFVRYQMSVLGAKLIQQPNITEMLTKNNYDLLVILGNQNFDKIILKLLQKQYHHLPLVLLNTQLFL